MMKKIKKSSLIFFKAFSAVCVSYVLALIGSELISYGLFSFVFLMISITLAFFYLVRPYGFITLLLIDTGLVLLALLLRFYVILAYGS